MNIYIDIETIPTQPETDAKLDIAETIKPPASMTKAETIADWHAGSGKYAGVKDRKIDEAYRKTALDGTRGETLENVKSLIARVQQSLGEVPGIVLANKADLAAEWEVTQEELSTLEETIPVIRTSAKSGDMVKDAFAQLSREMLLKSTSSE